MDLVTTYLMPCWLRNTFCKDFYKSVNSEEAFIMYNKHINTDVQIPINIKNTIIPESLSRQENN